MGINVGGNYGLSMTSHSLDLLNLLSTNDGILLPDFLSSFSFVVVGAVVGVRASVNTTEKVPTAAVEVS